MPRTESHTLRTGQPARLLQGLLCCAALSAPVLALAQNAATEAVAMDYPETQTVDHVDDYHGKQVDDPYRWLEQDVREEAAVSDWVGRQNQLTERYLETLPLRQPVRDRLAELWNYERFGIAPPRQEDYFFIRRGEHYFSFRNDGLKNQSVLYVQDSLDGEPRELIDPNSWSEDGTVAMAQFVPTEDGSLIAYGIQDAGSDWRNWRVLDVASGELLPDELDWLKFTSIDWLPDNSGFFYGQYPRPEEGQEYQSLNLNQKLMFHRLGTPQSEDVVIHARPDHPEWSFSADVAGNGRWLVIATSVGTDDRNRLELVDLSGWNGEANPPVQVVVDDFEALYEYEGTQDGQLLFRSTKDAPRARLLALDPAASGPDAWREVLGENESVLGHVELIGGKLLARYLTDARSDVRIHNADGSFDKQLELPGIGTASGFYGDNDHPDTYYHFSSFNQPPSIYSYNVQTGETQLLKSSKVDFNPGEYVVRQVFYQSKDGTRIPMFITHKKGLVQDASHPTLLYGYGGFNISIEPAFDPSRIAWLEMGGIYAVANLRGGGEYGEEWHKAGTKTRKQNVFDDFAAAAEFLIAERYTSPEHLAIYGRSNGGLLIGATINQRPELFAAALPQVGVMDMLRFQNFTAGRFWTDDYGSSANPEEFEALRAYSPYHNITDGQRYPATLVTTGDTDDRVVPGHSFKYAARLQAAQPADAPPTLIRIDTRAGHGDGKPTDAILDEYADMWSFIAYHTGLQLPEGF